MYYNSQKAVLNAVKYDVPRLLGFEHASVFLNDE